MSEFLSSPKSQPITERESKFYIAYDEDGDKSLFVGDNNLCTLSGLTPTFYRHGVLMSRLYHLDKDDNMKIFKFYTNSGKLLFEVNNYKSSNGYYSIPTDDISVDIYDKYVVINKTNMSTHEVKSSLVDIHTGEILNINTENTI